MGLYNLHLIIINKFVLRRHVNGNHLSLFPYATLPPVPVAIVHFKVFSRPCSVFVYYILYICIYKSKNGCHCLSSSSLTLI